ncbi:MAG: type III-B CRISPR-associated protein Cas10/Cmr2 [Nitrososphaerota archaeon]|nr:type III-B CRISPR-associated protein Cas10/Cmr2 [Nitrososphaerota archaeon]
MNELDVVRVCALLHDVGKLECWANRKPWSEHVYYTFKFVKACLGEDIAVHAMRHHTGSSYAEDYRPKTEIERIICLADNLASGADRREEPSGGPFIPSPPVDLTHVLSKDFVRKKFDAADLAYLSNELLNRLGSLRNEFDENSKETYFKIFDILSNSYLRFVPADTRNPINDVSLWNHMKLTAAFATCIFLSGWKGERLSNYNFAILSGDADRISSFINESLRLPDLNARSSLIKKATYNAYNSLSESLGPECVLFASGGSFLALSPVDQAEKVLNAAKKSFEETSEGQVSITVSFVVANGDEIQENFGGIWEEAQRKMRSEKGMRLWIPNILVDEGVETCDVCRKRQWIMEDSERFLPVDASPRPERLCNFCWSLRDKGKGVWLDDLKRESNFVACIRADGDDIGKVLAGKMFEEEGKACTPSRVSTLSDIIHKTCEKEFENIVKKFEGHIIFAGGDDLLAFFPGEAALKASRDITSKFRDEMAGKCTMSAGIAIFHYKLPVYVGVEAAGYLLSRAKEGGKNKVAWTVIGGSGVTSSELERVKPRSWAELDVVLSIVSFMRSSEVASHQLRRITRVASEGDVGVVEAEALIKSLMGRGVIDWQQGEKLLSYLETGLLADAFLIYNFFKGD